MYLIDKIRCVFYLLLAAFVLGVIISFLFFCLPTKMVHMTALVLCFLLLGLCFYYLQTDYPSSSGSHQNEFSLLLVLIAIFLAVNVYLSSSSLKEAFGYVNTLKEKLE